MRKSILVFVIVGLVALMAANYPDIDFESNEEGILFHTGSWEDALALAHTEGKLIFVDVYATWCGPCKAMKKHTFTNVKVGSYFNEHFVNVALNGESKEGRVLAQKFGVKAYPTLLFVKADGTTVTSISGYQNPRQLVSLGELVLNRE